MIILYNMYKKFGKHVVTSFLRGGGESLNLGGSRTWRREGSKNWEKVVTSFMDVP